jgi:hypothetical protein
MARSYEHGNEPSDLIRDREFLDQPSVLLPSQDVISCRELAKLEANKGQIIDINAKRHDVAISFVSTPGPGIDCLDEVPRGLPQSLHTRLVYIKSKPQLRPPTYSHFIPV